MQTDENRLEAENKYIAGSMTLRALAEQMQIPFSTICRWSKAGGWAEKRKKVNRRAQNKAITQAVNKKARELQKLLEASGEIEKALLMAARKFRKAMDRDKYGMVVDAKNRAANMAGIVNAIGRQAETRMLLSGILPAAEKEKLELMRRKQDWDEKRAQDENGGGAVIELAEGVEEYAE